MKKKVLLQVMGAVLVAGLMAGCGGTNDTKKEENTKTEAAADKERTSWIWKISLYPIIFFHWVL